MITLYGIPNCDTVKKARTWLDQAGLDYQFHDFKKAGLDKGTVDLWLKQVSWEILVNKKGMTWRNLSDATKASVVSAATATTLMLENTSVIKRPVLCIKDQVLVGFDADLYKKSLKA
jgi:arsenate reductase